MESEVPTSFAPPPIEADPTGTYWPPFYPKCRFSRISVGYVVHHARGGRTDLPTIWPGGSSRDVNVVAGVSSTVSPDGQANLRLLGSFELSIHDAPTNVSRPGQRVLAILALDHATTMERPYLAGRLWPDSSESAARSNLRSALFNLGSLRFNVLEATPGGLRLAPELGVDLHQRREEARRILDPTFDDVDAPLSSFATDLLPDWDELWVEPERELYRHLRLHVLERLSERLAKGGRFAEALEAALVAAEGAPLRESAQRAVIRVLAAEGNRGEAMSRYADLCAVLDEELGVKPSFHMDDVLSELAETI